MSPLPTDDIVWLLSLPGLELEVWLESLPATTAAAILEQLLAYRTDTEKAEASLHEFTRQAWSILEPNEKFIDNWHIAGICQHLEAMTWGKIKKLLINIPPGCMKSLLCAVMWPAWTWGPARKPERRFLCATYGDDLSTRDSLRCRSVIESEWYQSRWGDVFRFAVDQNRKTKFENDKTGWRIATSVGGPGTGEHPDFVIADDALSAQQAESHQFRERASGWWDGTISTRGVIRDVGQLVVGQRLHQKDLPGHVLDKGDFEHVCLPMEWESDRMKPTSLGWMDPRTAPGELLWPAAYSEARVRRLERDLTAIRAPGQLQQRPVDIKGGLFHRDWFIPVNACPPDAPLLVRFWDNAATAGGGDYTAGVLMAFHNGLYYVVHVVRGQWSTAEREAVQAQTLAADFSKWGFRVVTWFEQEGGSSGKDAVYYAARQFAGYSVFFQAPPTSKKSRATPMISAGSSGFLRLVKGDWNTDYVDEMAAFDLGAHDDQVDGSSGAFNKLFQTPPEDEESDQYEQVYV